MKYVFHNLKNNIFIICISLTLLLISFNYPPTIIIYILYNYYIYKKDKHIFYVNLVISFLTLFTTITIKLYQEYLINNYRGNITGKIIKIKETSFYTTLTLRYKIFKVKVKYFGSEVYKVGMIVSVKGNLKELEGSHLPNSFNYQKYFYNNLFIYDIKATEIVKIRQSFSIYFLSEIVKKYLEYFFSDDSLIILEGFILGDTSNFTNSFKDSLRINGIIHLFAVSGLHVSIIISIMDKIFKKCKYKNLIINIILVIYLFITSFMVSIMRAIFTYLLKSILDYKKIKLNGLDVTSIIYILFILVNPFFIYNLGFCLSFFATFIIILLNENIKNMGNIKSLIVITLVINLFTLPFLINTNNNFNILTPFINLLMVFLVESIILPISFLVFVLPILNDLFNYIVISFIKLSEFIAKFSKSINLVITIASISSIIILLFYILILLFLKTYTINKRINKIIGFIFIIFMGFIYFNGSFTITPKITFFDVSVGDAILLEKGNEKVLIDTGIGRNNEVTRALLSMGVKRLDYLIITHNHKDHNGEADIILEEIIVRKIVISRFDDSKYKNYKNCIRIKKGDKIKSKEFEFLCLSPFEYSANINNNSLVLLLKIYNTTILFTGDMEKEVEDNIKGINVDILKVAHHGSNTSTTSKFLNTIRPKYAIIQSGRENSFEFPSMEVVERLKSMNIKTFITKYDYTIKLFIYKKRLKFKKMNN